MTVSRVVNQNGYVSEETREKVLRVVKELNYRRNGLARGLKRQRTDTIAVKWPSLPDFSEYLARAADFTGQAVLQHEDIEIVSDIIVHAAKARCRPVQFRRKRFLKKLPRSARTQRLKELLRLMALSRFVRGQFQWPLLQ